jgi:hypothetical protein
MKRSVRHPGGNVEAGHRDLKKRPSVDFGCRLHVGWKVDFWFGGGRTKIEGDGNVQGFVFGHNLKLLYLL